MTEDFERTWLSKFSASMDCVAGSPVRELIMEGSDRLSDRTDRREIAAWSARAMALLDERVEVDKRVEIMTGCACQRPKADLAEIGKKYEETKDVDLVITMLQERFMSFLRDTLNLNDGIITQVLERGWGLAGRRDGDRVIATKIPKSAYIVQYLLETDAAKKRAIYCHCPRIRDAINADVSISHTYCYCGAGFYKGIWEYILQRPVRVDVLESVLKGGDACKFAVNLS